MISISTVNVPPDRLLAEAFRGAGGPKHARHPQIKGSSYDPGVDELLREVDADPATLGLVLHGSRAGGSHRADSDYDLIRVVTEEEYERRERHVKDGVTDVVLQTPERLRRLVDDRGWYTSLFLSARVLVDKTGGEIEGLVRAIVDAANDAAYAAVPEEYDGYLNCWTRSMKAWRRGDDLGGRLQAAQSAGYLIRALFGLEHRWPPYLDALAPALPAIEQVQGWGDGFLRDALLRLAGDGDPVFQQELEARVEALMAARGVEHEWPEDELEALRALRFRS